MKFELPAGALARAVGMVKGCVPSKTTIPVLSHVLFEARVTDAGHGELAVRATNLDMEAECVVPADVAEPGAAALPGEVVHGIAKLLGKSDTAKFSGTPDRMTLQAGRSRYTISGMNPDEFPLLDRGGDGVTFTMAGSALKALFETTRYCVSTAEDRVALQGVYLHIVGPDLVAVASDGMRFAKRIMPHPEGAADMPGCIVPGMALREVLNIAGDTDADVTVSVRADRFAVQSGGATFATRLIDAQYLQYQHVVRVPNQSAAVVRPSALSEAVQRATVIYSGVDTKQPSARLVVTADGIKLYAGQPGNNDAVEDVDAECRMDGAEFRMNVKFLAEMLGKWPETVDIEIGSDRPGSPIVFTSPSEPQQLHLIMPMMK